MFGKSCFLTWLEGLGSFENNFHPVLLSFWQLIYAFGNTIYLRKHIVKACINDGVVISTVCLNWEKSLGIELLIKHLLGSKTQKR